MENSNNQSQEEIQEVEMRKFEAFLSETGNKADKEEIRRIVPLPVEHNFSEIEINFGDEKGEKKLKISGRVLRG
jgi:hypothetical protein